MFFPGTYVEDFILHPEKHWTWIKEIQHAGSILDVDEILLKLRLMFALIARGEDPQGADEYVRVQL